MHTISASLSDVQNTMINAFFDATSLQAQLSKTRDPRIEPREERYCTMIAAARALQINGHDRFTKEMTAKLPPRSITVTDSEKVAAVEVTENSPTQSTTTENAEKTEATEKPVRIYPKKGTVKL